MKKWYVSLALSIALVLALAGVAAAGNFGWGVTGDHTVMAGSSIDITLNITASGDWNWKTPPGFPLPAFTVNTAYSIGAPGSSSTPMTLDGFTLTPQYGGKDNTVRQNDAVSGIATGILTLSAATDLTAGDYNITITPTATDGMTITPTPSIIYTVTVLPKPTIALPSVTINSPANGSDYLYGTAIAFSVSVDPAVDAVLATLDGNPFTLDFDSESGNWTSPSLSTLAPGTHIFTASATNSAGTGTATSTFTVHVNFGQWLPPILGSNKQMKAGSTLPVKFTIVGANGPLDDSVAKPHVFLGTADLGQATSMLDPTTGLPYFQLNIKLPAAGTYQVGVKEPNMTSQQMSIITK